MGWDMQMVTRNTKLYEGLVSVTKPIKDRCSPRRYSEVGRKNSMNVYAHEDSTVANVARCENKEFKRRVAKVIDPNSPDFHPIYAVATVLDPNNACLFDNGLKEVAETALLSMVRLVLSFSFAWSILFFSFYASCCPHRGLFGLAVKISQEDMSILQYTTVRKGRTRSRSQTQMFSLKPL
ncbi:unnamed protein product [Toxocara canis]|uniref:GLOBIN domain-containing protein n=1 Tax=Toxocara canis TaxID=6265 RepID=A0A183U5X9_TOXCA|nr:unnamed protein product [Toxocara canis]